MEAVVGSHRSVVIVQEEVVAQVAAASMSSRITINTCYSLNSVKGATQCIVRGIE